MDYGESPTTAGGPVEPESDVAPDVEETTATIPSGLFAATPKKGDVLSLRVVNVLDGEIEVALDAEAAVDGGEMSADDELDQMASA